MEIIKAPIDKVHGWTKNPRKIRKQDAARLKAQIERLGLYKPLLAVKENGGYTVLGGNQRIKILKELNHETVMLTLVDAKTEAQKLEYAMSDNDRAGSYDDEQLAELLRESQADIDPSLFKFDVGPGISTEALLNQYNENFYEEPEDTIPDPPARTAVKLGDIYQLGDHRIICGSATDPAAYLAVLGEEKADLIFTDPPYNVDYQGTKQGGILNDKMDADAFIQFSVEFFARFKDNLKAGGAFYICSGYSSYVPFVFAMKTNGLIFSCPIIWIKDHAAMGWMDYKKKHEMILKGQRGATKATPILYGWNQGRHYFADGKYEADVWQIKKKATTQMAPPTQKPLAMIQRAIKNSSKKGQIVLDPFGGSGGTIIAAEREGRRARLIELDPKYVDVQIRRYAALGIQTEAEIRATRTVMKQPK